MDNIVKRGRFSDTSENSDQPVVRFDESWFEPHLSIDRAHVVMLAEQGILTVETAGKILEALNELEQDGFDNLPVRTDLHVSIEEMIIKKTSEDTGGKMHTARSRNDKASTAFRLVVRQDILDLIEQLINVEEALIGRAEETSDWMISGYTHLQNAQPTTLGHHLLAHQQAFSRDFDRFIDSYVRVNRNPLGSAAFGGTGWDIDRERTTELLGFCDPLRNSMDAVATRDFIPESVSIAANAMTNLSRLCEDLVIWSSNEFGFAELADRHAGSSSIMPQKKNPSTVEYIRSLSGTVIGVSNSVMTTLKGLPMSQNGDLTTVPSTQWNTAFESTYEGFSKIEDVLREVSFNREQMGQSSASGFTTATELADTLVRETEISFRTAHHIVGRITRDYNPETVSPEVINEVAKEITDTSLSIDPRAVKQALDPRKNIQARDSFGGPGEIGTALNDINQQLDKQRRQFQSNIERLESAEEDLDQATRDVIS